MKETQKETKKKRAPRFGQRKVQVKIKKLREDAVIPTYAHDTDAAMDLTAVTKEYDKYGNLVFGFGLALEIPEGYVGLIFPRSSIHKEDLLLTNSVGVIDAGYRGEITAKFAARSSDIVPKNFFRRIWYYLKGMVEDDVANIRNNFWYSSYKVGDRVAQMIIMPYPKVKFQEVEELSETERGEGGYGSTGK